MNTTTIKMLDEVKNKESVLSFSQSSCKVDRLLEVMKLAFQNEGFQALIKRMSERGLGSIGNRSDLWFDQGLECELLEPNKNWRKEK